jgi:prepilin-type N-terminal cleavage/methylation domain-containing protein
MKILKKPCFTLLELLVVLFILAIGAISTGVKIKEAYAEQRFLSEVEQVLGHLQMAQDLMLILDTDVYVDLIKYQDKTLVFQLDVVKPLVIKKALENDSSSQDSILTLDKELSKKWAKFIERPISLIAIRSFDFAEVGNRDVPPSKDEDPKILKKVRLRFSLGKMSTGKLTLFNEADNQGQSEESLNRTIILVGYPCMIRHQTEAQLIAELNKIRESQDLYPKLKD